MVKEILNSPVLLIIIGALIGIIPSYFQNKQNNNYGKQDKIIEKKSKLYFDFLMLNQKIFTLNLRLVSNNNNQENDKQLAKLRQEISDLNETVKVELRLYSTKQIEELAFKELNLCNPKSPEEANAFIIKRTELMESIVKLMRTDMGIK